MHKVKGRILVVDDSRSIRGQIAGALKPIGYQVDEAENGMMALEKVTHNYYDLVTTDVEMPKMNGIQFLRFCRQVNPDVPVMMVTSLSALDTAVAAVRLGAYDYVTKPIDPDEFAKAVSRGLKHGKLKRENQQLLATLEARVQERAGEIADKNSELEALSQTLQDGLFNSMRLLSFVTELQNRDLGEHSRRVALLAKRIAQAHGLGDESVRNVELAGLLHDIGFIGMPEGLFAKESQGQPFEDSENRHYRNHPLVGAAMVRSIGGLQEVATLIQQHHERYDGSGFPARLEGDQVSVPAQILAIAEAVDTSLMVRGDSPNLRSIAAAADLAGIFDPREFADVNALLCADDWPEALPRETIALRELAPGMRLAEDLCTSCGLLLIGRGERVNAARIRQINDFDEIDSLPVEISIVLEQAQD